MTDQPLPGQPEPVGAGEAPCAPGVSGEVPASVGAGQVLEPVMHTDAEANSAPGVSAEVPVSAPGARNPSAAPESASVVSAVDSADPGNQPPAPVPSGAPAVAPVQVPTTPDLTLPPLPVSDYTAEGVPTFDFLRDKIDRRLGTALGSVEIAEAQVQRAAAARAQHQADFDKRLADAAARQQFLDEQRQQQASAKLAEIRRSLHPDTPAAGSTTSETSAGPTTPQAPRDTDGTAVRTVDPTPEKASRPADPPMRDIDPPAGSV